jgi:hypothetical protein
MDRWRHSLGIALLGGSGAINAGQLARVSHRAAFTQRSFTQRSFYTEELYTKELYTEKLVHRDDFAHRSFYIEKLLHRKALAHTSFYTENHREAFTPRSLA